MKKPDIIVIASQNEHKIQEFKEAFAHTDINVKSLLDYDNIPEIDENGTTFEQNATIKASAIAQSINQVVIADDSGLVVTSLNGEPGVRSARYAGDHDDAANNRKLLANLADKDNRDAYFESDLVYLTPAGEKVVAVGRVYGTILESERGANGFGYDPLFLVPESGKTLSEMTMHEKNQISHRGVAIKNLIPKLTESWQ